VQARKDLIRTSKLISQARGNVKSLEHAIALIQEKEKNKEQEPEGTWIDFAPFFLFLLLMLMLCSLLDALRALVPVFVLSSTDANHINTYT
jgi:hypothetical protein